MDGSYSSGGGAGWCSVFHSYSSNLPLGVLEKIVSDNGTPFQNEDMEKLCTRFHIKHHFSENGTPSRMKTWKDYALGLISSTTFIYLQCGTNGQAELFNKTLCKLLKKVVYRNKQEWHDRLLESLWAYRTTIRTRTRALHVHWFSKAKQFFDWKYKSLLEIRRGVCIENEVITTVFSSGYM